VADELFDGRVEGLRLERRQPVEDEEGALRSCREPRSAALTPIPAPAGHAEVVAPDDLPRPRRAVWSVECLVAGGADEAEITLKPIEVLPAHRNHVPKADRVVGVDERVDARQRPSLQHPPDERLGR